MFDHLSALCMKGLKCRNIWILFGQCIPVYEPFEIYILIRYIPHFCKLYLAENTDFLVQNIIVRLINWLWEVAFCKPLQCSLYSKVKNCTFFPFKEIVLVISPVFRRRWVQFLSAFTINKVWFRRFGSCQLCIHDHESDYPVSIHLLVNKVSLW